MIKKIETVKMYPIYLVYLNNGIESRIRLARY